MIFRDRTDAGRKLATRLTRYANGPDVLVLALPRGGVPVAHEVAKELTSTWARGPGQTARISRGKIRRRRVG